MKRGCLAQRVEWRKLRAGRKRSARSNSRVRPVQAGARRPRYFTRRAETQPRARWGQSARPHPCPEGGPTPPWRQRRSSRLSRLAQAERVDAGRNRRVERLGLGGEAVVQL